MVLCFPAHAGGAGHRLYDQGCAVLNHRSPEACECVGQVCMLAGSGRWPGKPLDECNQESLQKSWSQVQTEATVDGPGLCCAWQFQHLLVGSWAGPVLPRCGMSGSDTESCMLPGRHCRPAKGCRCFLSGQVKEPVPASAWHTISELQREALREICHKQLSNIQNLRLQGQ